MNFYIINITIARVITGISTSTWVAFTVFYASYYVGTETTKVMGID